MKKLLALILPLAILLCACGNESQKESPVEDFAYEMSNGKIIITGYLGTDQEIFIPSEINERPVTVIGEDAFEGYDMTHITIPDSVVEIDEHAFADCVCLTSVKLSKGLEIIGEYAFRDCEALSEIVCPDTVIRIDEGAFIYSGLNKVTLPKNLQYLGVDAFANCENLTSLKIPDNTEIEIDAYRQDAGYVGYITNFRSPVGGSHTATYYDSETDAAVGNKDFKQLPTAIVVTENSYAHNQVEIYADYGLNIIVE